MIEKLVDVKGDLQAVCEWGYCYRKGDDAKEPNAIFIQDLYINPSARGNGVVKDLIRHFLTMCPDPRIKGCYFFRVDKYPKRSAKYYPRLQWARLVKEN